MSHDELRSLVRLCAGIAVCMFVGLVFFGSVPIVATATAPSLTIDAKPKIITPGFKTITSTVTISSLTGALTDPITVNFTVGNSNGAVYSTHYTLSNNTGSIAMPAGVTSVTATVLTALRLDWPMNIALTPAPTVVFTLVNGTGYTVAGGGSDIVNVNITPVWCQTDGTNIITSGTVGDINFQSNATSSPAVFTYSFPSGITVNPSTDNLTTYFQNVFHTGSSGSTFTSTNSSITLGTIFEKVTDTTTNSTGSCSGGISVASSCTPSGTLSCSGSNVVDSCGAVQQSCSGSTPVCSAGACVANPPTCSISSITSPTASGSTATVNYSTGNTTNAYFQYTLPSGVTISPTTNPTASFAPGTSYVTGAFTNTNGSASNVTISLWLQDSGGTWSNPCSGSTSVSPASTVNIAATDAAAIINTSPANTGTYSVSRTSGTSALTVNYSVGGTGTKGTHYNLAAGTCTSLTASTFVIPLNLSSCTITLTPVNASFTSGTKTAILTPAAGSGYTAGTGGTVTISLPTVNITANAPTTITQNGSPNSTTYTFARTTTYSVALPVTFNTTGGTAAVTTDFTLSGTGGTCTSVSNTSATIPANTASCTVTITATTNTILSGSSKTAKLTPVTASGYVAGSLGTVTINGPAALPAITLTRINGAEPATNGSVTFTRSVVAASSLVVNYTVGGTATPAAAAGNDGLHDYQTLSGSATIPASQAGVTIPVTVFDDTIVEGTETVIINVTANANYSGTPSITVNITDNDVDICTDIPGTQASPPAGCQAPSPSPGVCIPSGEVYNGFGCVVPSGSITLGSFYPSPSRVRRGNTTTLNYTTAGEIYCAIDHGVGTVPSTDSAHSVPSTAISQATVFTLACGDGTATTTSSASVGVLPIYQEI